MKYRELLKPLALYLIAVAFALAVLALVYPIIDHQDPARITKATEHQEEITTLGGKWLNGHFGFLFRFKYLGNINWLVLPLALWFLFHNKKYSRPVKALTFVWLATALFLAPKDYTNSRYQLTLFPFTVVIILLLMWELIKKQSNWLKALAFSTIALVCLYNIYHYLPQYASFWKMKVSRTEPHFPVQMMDFILKEPGLIQGSSKVLVLNQPLFFYYTPYYGIDWFNPFYVELFVELRQPQGNRRKLFQIVRNKYNVKYIFLNYLDENQNQDRIFGELLNCECRLLFNHHGYRFYELRDIYLGKILNRNAISLDRGTKDMKVLGQRGEFIMENEPDSGTLSINNLQAGEKGERILMLGIDGTGIGGLGNFSKGRFLHFVVRARISKHLINRDNYLFIQDKDTQEKWESQKLYFRSHHWQTYLITREIRENSTDIALGVRFSPDNGKEKLKIKDVQVYISNQPL